MRIWSKCLIQYLPNKQLKAMRYELGDMIKQHPNIKHPLVKFANNYNCCYLGSYFLAVCREMDARNINKNISYDVKIIDMCIQKSKSDEDIYNSLIFQEDNKRYLKQCYYNLQEKYDRDMLTDEEWNKIKEVINYE